MISSFTESNISEAVDAVLADRRAMPAVRSTYRVQFNKDFTFDQATDLVAYWADLGISHLYASPIFAAAPGSMHGYDVVDYGRLNPEIGSRDSFDRLVRTLHQHGMGLIIDFVPNHMGIENGANAWWQDVLENGRMSRFAEYFDIDWNPLKFELRGKVLLPFLGGQYGEVLERGELQLIHEDGQFRVQYWDTPFPIDPQTYPAILERVRREVEGLLAPDDIDELELESVISAFDRLPVAGPDEPEAETVHARYREQTVSIRRLAELISRNQVIREGLDRVLTALNGSVERPGSFDALDDLLMQQHYRLSYWRVASEEINYRRFFAINTLASIRQEDPPVFDASHEFLIKLIADGAVDGVRFDHPDGLWDPERYFHDVQVAYVREAVRRRLRPGDEEWQTVRAQVDGVIRAAFREQNDRDWPVWTVAEKILEHGEELPPIWKIDGTVGYEFMQAANGVLVNQSSRSLMDTIYSRFTGEKIRFHELEYQMKIWQLREAFASEVNVLTNVANRISEADRHSRDFTATSLRNALREILANFSVYRTYSTCRDDDVSERDAAYINAAVDEAMRRNPQLAPNVFEFLRSALLLHKTGEVQQRRYAPCHFAMKVQQLSGPVMAKGLEDTTFYRFNRLTSLNEVGGDPAGYGTTPGEFHRQNQERLAIWPRSMINSTTHDTKRAEDVRAAISVISERPTEWRAGLNRWERLNRKFKVMLDGALAPTRSDTWVLYQTLVGTWPVNGTAGTNDEYVARIQEYMIKVIREAARFSNWINPNEPYETAMRDFIAGMLNKRRSKAFLKDFDTFVAAQRDAALMNALSQQIMKLTSPGVADIYQGTEIWNDSLVDPDNRRPVDFDKLQQMLADDQSLDHLLRTRTDGALKLHITNRLLEWRKEHRELFASGEYTQVRVSGPAAEHVIAWMRSSGSDRLLVVVPRLLFGLGGEDIVGNTDIWGDTSLSLAASLERDGWTNVLAGARHEGDISQLSNLFETLPLAVLAHEGAEA